MRISEHIPYTWEDLVSWNRENRKMMFYDEAQPNGQWVVEFEIVEIFDALFEAYLKYMGKEYEISADDLTSKPYIIRSMLEYHERMKLRYMRTLPDEELALAERLWITQIAERWGKILQKYPEEAKTAWELVNVELPF